MSDFINAVPELCRQLDASPVVPTQKKRKQKQRKKKKRESEKKKREKQERKEDRDG